MWYNTNAKQNQIFQDKRPIFIGGLVPFFIFASQIESGKNAAPL